jgi:hypothetical protein
MTLNQEAEEFIVEFFKRHFEKYVETAENLAQSLIKSLNTDVLSPIKKPPSQLMEGISTSLNSLVSVRTWRRFMRWRSLQDGA